MDFFPKLVLYTYFMFLFLPVDLVKRKFGNC